VLRVRIPRVCRACFRHQQQQQQQQEDNGRDSRSVGSLLLVVAASRGAGRGGECRWREIQLLAGDAAVNVHHVIARGLKVAGGIVGR